EDMWTRIWCPAGLIAALCLAPGPLAAQDTRLPRVEVAVGGGLLTSGAYFTGGNLALDNSDAFAGVLQVIVPVHRSWSLVTGGVYARPTWRVTCVLLLGSVVVDGARLWFADAAVRRHIPLGRRTDRAPTAFAQLGAGLAHYG